MSFKSWYKKILNLVWKETQEDINEKAREFSEQVTKKIADARAEYERKLGNESARPDDYQI